ncbi:MAG TPA: hypothetical protein VFS16_14555, partial [Acidimicrobiia bacterium]|nr:hypothetical protein [Acidimicrobiia bacterium]
DAGRDAELGAALSGLPVPDHGPTFWADLSTRLQGENPVSNPIGPATDAGPAESVTAPPTTETTPISLDRQRARRATRRGRTGRSLGAAAAAVTLVVVAAGAVAVIRDDGSTDRQVQTADRPTGTSQPAPPTPTAPAEFSATYDGIEGRDGPDGCCSQWRLTLADDGSFRWTSTDGKGDMAYDAAADRHVQLLTIGPGISATRPGYFQTLRIPEGGPDQRFARPEPLGPVADFVVALARAGDSRITTSTVAGRAAWHYDGPTAVDRLGGDGAPNHAVADVDQATGVLLQLTTRVDELVVNRFTAADVTTRDTVDRSRYRIEVPAGAQSTEVDLGFESRTLDEAAASLPYPLLVPGQVPAGFTLESVQVDRDVASPTGPEGMNPPAKQIAAVTWRSGASRFTVTLRPSGGEQWDNPFGGEGVVLDSSPVRFELPGRPPLEGTVAVDAPALPHLWGITGDVVVTISGDLSRAELERVAASLRPHGDG